MPLNRQAEARRVADIGRLRCAILRMTIDNDLRSGRFDPLPVQRIGHHLGCTEQLVKGSALGQCYPMAQCEFLVDRSVGGHAVVHPPRQFANLRIEAAPQGDIDLLKPAANTQKWLSTVHQSADQWQSDRITSPVKCSVGVGLGFTVLFRVHVWPPTSEQKPIASFQQLGDRNEPGIGRD